MVVEGYTASDHSSASRYQLLEWLREEFDLNIKKIEECGTGAVYMQIIDKLTWTSQMNGAPLVQMKRVRWDTDNEFDFADNYKLLQKAFSDHQIKKNIPVQQLMKARMQDNLAFLHFLHNLYLKYYVEDESYPGGWARRQMSIHGNFKAWAMPRVCDQNAGMEPRTREQPMKGAIPSSTTPSRAMPVRSVQNIPNTKPNYQSSAARASAQPPRRSATQQQIEELQMRIVELEKALEDADVDINLLNDERAKYYVQLLCIEKLRLVRTDSRGADTECITPNEILACIDNSNLPHDIRQFENEFDYKLYTMTNDDVSME